MGGSPDAAGARGAEDGQRRPVTKTGQIWKSAAPDFTVTPLLQVERDGSVLSENRAWGTQTAVLRTAIGDIPPTGHEFGAKYVGVFGFRDGRISAQRIYFDRMVIVEMLGMPVPALAG